MTSLTADVRADLGRHLRELRTSQGLTLAQLAGTVGVTASALSQIERGRSEPSLGTLWRLGRALNASLFDFFAREQAPTVDVTRASERTVVEFERLRYEAVARSAQREIDLFFLRLRPGEGPARELTSHAGEESGVVLEGSMDVLVAGERHRLGPGDGIWFLSSQPHTFEAVGDQECLSVWADTVVDPGVIRGGGGSIFEAAGVRAVAAKPAGPPALAARAPGRTGLRRDAALAVARRLPIDAAYLREVVERLAAVGSSPLGFRTTGTPEDRAVAELVAEEMRRSGLGGVAIEDVRVDGWRFEGAALDVDGRRIEGSSMGGVPSTKPAGVDARLLDGGDGRLARLDGIDLDGALVLVDWRTYAQPLCDVALELGLRGAAGIVANCPPGADFYQSDGVIGAFGGHWHDGAPPMILIAKEAAAAIRERLAAGGPLQARMTLRADRVPDALGANVVGHLGGRTAGAPLIVGAHHDGWFRAAFDNASGVAAMLAMAQAFAAAGHSPQHPVCFTSRTAEEYGLRDSPHDWCIGAWRQVSDTHPEWGAGSPFHLCVEASGHPDLRLLLEAPVELAGWARATARAGRREGWLTSSWRIGPPVTGTEQWPLLVSGIPGIAAYTWERSFMRSDYHTPRDTPALLDFDHLERLTRFYAYLLLRADADPDGILDHRARAEDVAAAAAKLDRGGERLAAAARGHAAARGRAAFTRVGRELLGVDAGGALAYPHQQAAADVDGLEAALAALVAGDRRGAARALGRVGDNAAARRLSETAFARRARRLRPDAAGDSWASASHLTASPELWAELAALDGRPAARPVGAWLRASLEAHLVRSRAQLAARVDAMAVALEDPGTSRRSA